MIQKISQKKNFFVFLSLIIISILIFALDQSAFLNSFKSFLFSGAKPILSLSDKNLYILTKPFEILINYQKNKDELTSLMQKKLDLTSIQVEIDEIRRENDFLRKALGLKEQKKQDFFIAKVIGRSSEANQSVIVNVGKGDGLTGSETMILPDKFLIGKVTDTYESISQAKLLNSSDFSVSVMGEKTRTDALCTGAGDSLEIEIINYQDQPEIGEIFITSGIDGYSPGLIVGQLEKIIVKPSAVSRIGVLKPLVNLNQFEQVLLLKND
ncbi:MAG: rod shape-determining protein MreC [Candidatus Paceibacterota bacterium]|jgi:rod shape-determining protein MreC